MNLPGQPYTLEDGKTIDQDYAWGRPTQLLTVREMAALERVRQRQDSPAAAELPDR